MSTSDRTVTSPSLTRVFVGIKLSILRNSFVRDRRLRLGMTVITILAVVGAGAGFWRFFTQGHASSAEASHAMVLSFTLLFGAWVFGPIVMGGVDDTLDPTRLALLPIRRDEMRRGLVAASLTGHIPVATVIALLGAIVGFARLSMGGFLVVMAVVMELLLALGAARALAVGLAHTSRSRKGRDVSVVMASLGGSVLWLGTQSVRLLSTSQYEQAIRVMRWLPAGALGQAVVDAREAQYGVAATRILIGGLLALLMLRWWMTGLDRLLILPESVRHARHKAEGDRFPLLGTWVGRFGHRPWAVVMVKELRYLVRAPQRRSALLVGTVIGAPFAFLQVLRSGHLGPGSVWFAPASLLFGIGASNNLLGADAAALWLETSSGLRMRTLLAGKSLAAIPYVVLPVLVSATAMGALSGNVADWLHVVALTLLCWGVPLGIGCLVSVYAPFPQPDTGNPFANRRPSAGEGCLIGILGVVGLGCAAVLLSPVALVTAYSRHRGLVVVLASLVFSGAWSLGIWTTGLRLASRHAQRREAELLHDLGQRRGSH